MKAADHSRLPRILASGRRAFFFQLVAIGLGQALAAVAAVYLVRSVFDHFIHTGPRRWPLGDIWPMALGLAAIALVKAGLRMAERVRAERLGQDYVVEVRGLLFEHLTRVAPRVLRQHSRGGMLLRFTGDLTPLRQWLSLGLARITVAAVVASVTLTALAWESVALSGCVFVALLAGALVSLSRGPALEQCARLTRRERSRLATNVTEKIAAMPVVQVHGQESRELNRLNEQSQRLAGAMIQRARAIGWLRAIAQATSRLATYGTLLMGAWLVASGSTTPGGVVAAMTLVGFLRPHMRDLSRVYEYWKSATISLEKLEGFLALPAFYNVAGRKRRRHGKTGSIVFRGVSVNGVLDKVDMVVPAGSFVALTGANGSGKSTLLNLTARLLSPDSGHVLLDGRDLAKMRRTSLRKALGMVSPDLPLLRGSIRKNVLYRWPQAPLDEFSRVCRLCGVDEITAGLPQGAKTSIREGGLELSVGQRRRIALARAILGTPDVLLLDEAETNLDDDSQEILRHVLETYPGTVLLATHTLAFAEMADTVWNLEGGQLYPATRSGSEADDSMSAILQLAADRPHRGPLPRGRTVAIAMDDPGMVPDYHLHVPQHFDPSLPLFVAVHGISRNAREHAVLLSAHVARLGVVVVAPRFDEARFSGYQRLACRDIRPDHYLLRVVADVQRRLSLHPQAFILFGFSGGGQFVHRFALIHPDRVRLLIAASPGCFTFPDPTQPYPRGTGRGKEYSHIRCRLDEFLRVPTHVVVGARDQDRDSALNQHPLIDEQQGVTRLQRAQRWVAAMRQAALSGETPSVVSLSVLPGVAHSFVECVAHANINQIIAESCPWPGIVAPRAPVPLAADR